MAPRRRPLKKGESRMNAALDAMTPLGFDKKLVHQTVNKLLKVYDSSEGWGFIEDGAYHLLIDQLLEAQQQTQQQDHHFHIDQLLEAQQQAQQQDQEEQHIQDLSLVNEFHPEMRREDLTKKDSMSNSTGRITRSKSNSSQKFNSLSVGSSSREREDKEDGPSHKINYVDGLVDKNPSCLVSTRLTTVNPNVRKNPDFTKQLGFDDGEKRNRGEISCPDLKEGSQGMSPDKEPLALSEPLKLLDDDTHEVPEDSFSEPVIDNGLLNHTDNNVTNFNVGFPFGAPTDKVNVDSENQAPNTVSWGQNGDLVRPTLLSNGKVTSFSTNFNNFKNSTEGFTNDAEHSCSQHKRRKLEKLVDFMGQRPASGTSSIKEDNLEAVIGVQRSAFDQADDTRQARMPADAMVDAREIQEKEGPSWKVRKEEASRSEKYKAASNYYSTTYTVDELMQSKSMKKESCSKLKWDSGTRQYVDMLVDAIKKDQAQKAKKKEGPSPTVKKEEDMENTRP